MKEYLYFDTPDWVYAIYHNPDAESGNQYVEYRFNRYTVELAVEETMLRNEPIEAALGHLEWITNCTEYLHDIGTDLYAVYDDLYREGGLDIHDPTAFRRVCEHLNLGGLIHATNI